MNYLTRIILFRISALLLFFIPVASFAQTVYNANFQTLNFGGSTVTVVNKVGDGKSLNNIVLYRNIITVSGQAIDVIIKTTGLSTGTVMDYFDRTGTGTGFTYNENEWFSPQFTFPSGGGTASFNFQFIQGNSYNNTTNTGTAVILENVRINTYDIDGNGQSSSNQFNEFGGFFKSELSSSTTIATSYNAVTGLTKFRSTISTNVSDADDPSTRVRVTYAELSNFSIQVGAGAAGQAYFFLDFGVGDAWPTTPTTVTAPSLDLNTGTAGNNNSGSFCSTAIAFSAGSTNIGAVSTTPSGGTTVDRLRVTITTAKILNGASEKLIINGATSGGTIALNFANAASIPNVVLSTKTFAVAASVTGGESILTFTKNGSSTMTIAESELLLDAFNYQNTASTPTVGNRVFEIKLKDGAYESQAYTYTATVTAVPTFSQQPMNAAAGIGTTQTFTVASTASTYQWQVDPKTGVFSNVVNSAMYSGATTNQLTVTNIPSSMNNYLYRCLTTNGGCSVLSNVSTLGVSAVLPVTWLSFNGRKQNKSILLNWTTASEYNSKEFIVEHSVDGISFTGVGKTGAAGNSHTYTNYSFVHPQPSEGNNYYRIQQVDLDGKKSYSNVFKFVFGADNSILTILSNPVINGQLSVQLSAATTLYFFNSEGRILFKQQLKEGAHRVDVSTYAKGTYTVRAGDESKKIAIR